MTVALTGDEWQRVLAILAQAPWVTANPLIMKIGEQLRGQEPSAQAARGNGAGVAPHQVEATETG